MPDQRHRALPRGNTNLVRNIAAKKISARQLLIIAERPSFGFKPMAQSGT
jgi:hypothetical protein